MLSVVSVVSFIIQLNICLQWNMLGIVIMTICMICNVGHRGHDCLSDI